MRGRLALATTFLAYLAALVFRRDRVPAGICNDTAEEALRGVLLLARHRFEPITNVLGNSAETLYLYLLGLSARLLGQTTLAIELVSWLFALGVIAMTAAVTRRIEPSVPPAVPLAIAASSVWLFHYARAGLRAISAPLFLLLFVWFAMRAEERRRDAILAGVFLALGIYGYTAFRAVAIAWVLWAIWRRKWKPALTTAIAALIVSIPNLIFLVRAPNEFLLRGAYVVRDGKLGNVVATALMPFVYFREYRDVNGPHHFFDGVSAGLTHTPMNPVHPLIAILFLAGLVFALRQKKAGLLLLCGAVTIATIGIAGPSLTRMLVALPVLLVVASLAAARLTRLAFAAVIAVVVATHGYAYFVRFPANQAAQFWFSPAGTPIGQRAAELGRGGARVLCIVTKDANVVRYLAPHAAVAEFYNQPYDARLVPDVHPSAVLIESDARFAGVERAFPGVRVETFSAAGAPRR